MIVVGEHRVYSSEKLMTYNVTGFFVFFHW